MRQVVTELEYMVELVHLPTAQRQNIRVIATSPEEAILVGKDEWRYSYQTDEQDEREMFVTVFPIQ